VLHGRVDRRRLGRSSAVDDSFAGRMAMITTSRIEEQRCIASRRVVATDKMPRRDAPHRAARRRAACNDVAGRNDLVKGGITGSVASVDRPKSLVC